MEEKWREIYTEEEIKSIQKIEVESLKVFIKLCKKLEIEFILYGGTLLGAVKYQGFVPWDDDLDVALMRKDYDKLIELGPSLLPDKYELQHPLTNKVSPFSYLKFRRTDTKLVEYSLHKLRMNHGIYFDIYPLDNIPDDDDLMYDQYNDFSRLAKLFYYRQVSLGNEPVRTVKDVVKSFVSVCTSIFLRLIPHKYYVSKMYQVMTRYNDIFTQRQGNYFHSKPVNYFYGIYPLIEVQFEGLTLKIPSGYEGNLQNRYGDISKLPPEGERLGHKAYIVEIK